MSKFARDDSIYTILNDITSRISSLERIITNSNFIQSSVYGSINTTTPIITSGTGFIINKLDTALVEITFERPFTSPPVVIVSAETGQGVERSADSYSVTATKFGLYRWNSSTDAAADGQVHFIALGSI